jgi:hypothetical protein
LRSGNIDDGTSIIALEIVDALENSGSGKAAMLRCAGWSKDQRDAFIGGPC